MSGKFLNDYYQQKLPSRKYFRKTAGSSNNIGALSEPGRCGKRRPVWPVEYEQTAFPRSTSSAGHRLVVQWIQLNDIAQHSSNSRSFVHGQHRAELIPLVHESLGSCSRHFPVRLNLARVCVFDSKYPILRRVKCKDINKRGKQNLLFLLKIIKNSCRLDNIILRRN